MKVWFNGRIVDDNKARLSLFDHAFLYGDGLYETVRVENGRIFLWAAHYARLKRAAAALSFSFPWTRAALERIVIDVVRANRKDAATARLTLSRGTGPLGLDPALCPRPTLVVQLHPDRDLDAWRRTGVTLGVVHAERGPYPNFKSISMQPLVRARQEAVRLRIFEGLLINRRGEITEGTTSNVFFVRRGVLHTPAAVCGLLPGVTRGHVLRIARRLRIPVHEGRYRPADLLRAEEIFLTNASLMLMPVRSFKHGRRTVRFDAARPVLARLQTVWERML